MRNKKVPLEKVIVAQIKKSLDKYYPGFYFKTHGGPFQRAGLPDIIGVHRGRFIAIEVKRPGREDTLTELQQSTIDLINLAGGISFMATSPDQVGETLGRRLREPRP